MLKQRSFETLDGLRGVAALAVFALHSGSGALHRVSHSAYLAVDVFFVLSGFVLSHAYAEKLAGAMSWAQFARLRIIRLYPLYALGTLLGLSLVLARLALAGGHGLSEMALADAAGQNLLFLPAWHSGVHTSLFAGWGVHFGPFPFDYPLWSLFWELVFSLVFALIVSHLGRGLLIAILACSGALVAAVAHRYGSLDIGFFDSGFAAGAGRLLFSFFAGVAVHRLWRSGALAWLRLPAWAALAVLAAVLAAPAGPYREVFDLAAVLVVFPVLILAATGQPRGWLAPLCVRLGAASYGFYVLHVPLLLWMEQLSPALTGRPITSLPAVAWLAAAGLILLAAALADRFFDRPCRAALTELTGSRARFARA